jgi:hypothetical protein
MMLAKKNTTMRSSHRMKEFDANMAAWRTIMMGPIALSSEKFAMIGRGMLKQSGTTRVTSVAKA